QIGVAPDFQFSSGEPDGSVVWLHRQLSDGDLYFVANRQRRTEDVVISLRATGRQPELWNPETGEMSAVPIYSTNNGRLELPLHLDPAESLFVVLRQPMRATPVQSLSRDGEKIIQTSSYPPTLPARYDGLVNTFTVSVWVKPDIDLRLMPEESTTGRINET